MNKILMLIAFVLLLGVGAVSAVMVAEGPAAALALVSSTEPANGTKVFVCKYVGKPGVDERLQTGQNPIDVDVSSIIDYHGIGSFFEDAQGRSFVLGPEHRANEHVDTPDISLCPNPEGPPTTSSTTTTTTSSTTTTVPTTTGTPRSVITAGAVCDIANSRYVVIGNVDGQPAPADPQFIPGDKDGITLVTVTLGSVSGQVIVNTNGTCVSTVTTSPGTTTTTGGGGSGGGGTTSTTPNTSSSSTTTTSSTTQTTTTTTSSTTKTATTTPSTTTTTETGPNGGPATPPPLNPTTKKTHNPAAPGKLPFTGFPLWAVALIGLSSILTGLTIRKKTQ